MIIRLKLKLQKLAPDLSDSIKMCQVRMCDGGGRINLTLVLMKSDKK